MGNGEMVFYRIKKVKGNYYLVKEWYDPELKKKITRSIGPCKFIEELMEVVKKNSWCGGWDLNPRRPTPSGPKLSAKRVSDKGVSPVKEGLIVADSGKLDEFLKWCLGKGTSYETCSQYVNYLKKPLNRDNKWSVLAYKAYFKFTRNEELWKSIKTKQSRPDLNIPTEEEVLNTLKAAYEASTELYTVYILLVESGARLAEIVKMLREFDHEKLKKHNGFYTYTLSYFRGSKRSFYIFTVSKPSKLVVAENWVSNWASKNKMVSPKYIRKFVATKMASLEIPMEIVNFIQGRVPRSILEKHYLNMYALALKHYPKYAKWLQEKIEVIR